MYVSTLTSKSPLEGGNVPTRGRAAEAKSASGGYVPARTPKVGSASGGNAPARVQTPASGSYAPARGSRPHMPVESHYFSVYLVDCRGDLMTSLMLVVPIATDR